MIQIILFTAGVFSLWYVNSKSAKMRELAAIVGLITQPLWLLTALQSGQWAMAALSVIYAACWARSIRWKRALVRMRGLA